jgi:hypothetical protein
MYIVCEPMIGLERYYLPAEQQSKKYSTRNCPDSLARSCAVAAWSWRLSWCGLGYLPCHRSAGACRATTTRIQQMF